MTRKAGWRKGLELQKTSLALPRTVWEKAKIRAMKEGRTLQEVVATAIEQYLRKARPPQAQKPTPE